MSTYAPPYPAPQPPPPPRRSLLGTFFRVIFGLIFIASLALNVFFLVIIALALGHAMPSSLLEVDEARPLTERFFAGRKGAETKIAIVQINGVLMEGMTGYFTRQIEQAAKDNAVSAVVVRINSPGGTITSSDHLYEKLVELRDGDPKKHTSPKPLIVSMGSIAASGGYYIAVPAQTIYAERTAITGSIGVYASFPNVSDFAKEHGIHMNTIKAGEVKDSGSMFHPMTGPERQMWQDMVDHAFQQFIDVVKTGRSDRLKFQLRAEIPSETKQVNEIDDKGNVVMENGKAKKVPYTRRLADGGIYTADKAEKYGLIDKIGTLEDAIAAAAQAGNAGDQYKAITYYKPLSLLSILLGVKESPPPQGLDLGKLGEAMSPRLWYLAPQSEITGMLSAR